MSLPISFANDSLTRVRAGLVTDSYQNQVRDWASATTLDMSGWSVQPVPAPETAEGTARNTVGRRWLALGPAGTDVLATDRMIYAGITCEVDGAPLVYATGVLDHVELFLQETEG